jgi:hypothetical protein
MTHRIISKDVADCITVGISYTVGETVLRHVDGKNINNGYSEHEVVTHWEGLVIFTIALVYHTVRACMLESARLSMMNSMTIIL